jgi:hypothetical protein
MFNSRKGIALQASQWVLNDNIQMRLRFPTKTFRQLDLGMVMAIRKTVTDVHGFSVLLIKTLSDYTDINKGLRVFFI